MQEHPPIESNETRDLTYGLVALQLRQIGKAPLVEALTQWLTEPGPAGGRKSLRTFLLAEGHVTAEADAILRETLSSMPADAPGARVPVEDEVRRTFLDLPLSESQRSWVTSLQGLPARPPSEHPRVDKRYLVGREIGRGGLASVFEAEDRSLKREVAIKVIRPGLERVFAERFVREAQVTARLDHPNVVPVHDYGLIPAKEGGDRLFICMKRIRGRNLDEVVAALRSGDAKALGEYTRTRLLGIFQDVCLGVAYAHSKGVIHRDLKPANIMVGDFGETLIVDWGLAKVPGAAEESVSIAPVDIDQPADSTQLTLAGSVLGTPAFMPPEQAQSRLADIDERSDIFALGAILYVLLTWELPWPDDAEAASWRGEPIPPSRRVERGAFAGRSAVSPDLDAICLKAMASLRKNRFQSPLEMYREIQVILEGTRERERAENEARDRVRAGSLQLASYRDLRDQIQSQRERVAEWGAKIEPHQAPEEKRPLWDAERELKRLEEARVEAFAAATAEFNQALAIRGDLPEALRGRCELIFDRYLEAESKRDEKEMLLGRRTLERYDRDGQFQARLDAPGTISLRTFSRACNCLAPVQNPAWQVELAASPLIPWREGQARPDLPLTEKDRPVSPVRTSPDGVRWGHSGACVREEVRGVEVWAARYELRDKRLQLGELRLLGSTPLVGAKLPQGSWRCSLRGAGFAEALLPVRILRDSAWSQEVNLYREVEIPSGFCYVPGGPFTFGGLETETVKGIPCTTRDLFVSRFPTTCADYLEFLNDLVSRGSAAEARERAPRDADKKILWIEVAGGFRMPAPHEDPDRAWDPRWPIASINWFDATAYCSWKSGRDGRVYRLLHEEEYEKATRGVDERAYAYGDEFEASYSHSSASIPVRASPMPVDSFPMDESPYGVRGLSGGMSTWCMNLPEVPHREWRCLRGGSWSLSPWGCRSVNRKGMPPLTVNIFDGIRLAAAPGI